MRKALYATAPIIVMIVAYQAWRWSTIPRIARNLPSNIAAADMQFKARLRSQFPIGMAESDLVRNGNDLWLWSSQNRTADHYVLPADSSAKEKTSPG